MVSAQLNCTYDLSQARHGMQRAAAWYAHLLDTSLINTLFANELDFEWPLQSVVSRGILYLKQGVIHQVWATPDLHKSSACSMPDYTIRNEHDARQKEQVTILVLVMLIPRLRQSKQRRKCSFECCTHVKVYS